MGFSREPGRRPCEAKWTTRSCTNACVLSLGGTSAMRMPFDVHVDNGIVKLTGEVLAAEDAEACKAIRRVPGVRHVEVSWTVRSAD